MGTFSDGHLPYTVDQRHDPALQWKVPTLAEMTQAALNKLEKESPFILQVEGGRVDHACHNCDAAGALNDMVAFDEAIDVCLEFQQRQPDTLLVITTDHGNGNLGLNATGSGYGKSTWMFENLLNVKASFPEMMDRLKRSPTEEEKAQGQTKNIPASPAEIIDIIQEATGYRVPRSKAELFAPFLAGKGESIFNSMNTDMAQLGQVMGNYLAIGWAGHDHTADYVPVTATGPGSEHFQGLIQNTQVFDIFTSMADIEFRNPNEPLVAMKPGASSREAGQVENTREYLRA